jgi:Pyruvate/2-oxoacid:ferredoxin oxidoreductase delta subunit
VATDIFYFSGTGNSLVVARDLAEALADATVTSMPDGLRRGAESHAGTVGLVFPVYAWGMPPAVRRFVRQLSARSDAYVFGVATCGGMPGATMRQLGRELKARGLTLSAGWAVTMPNSCTAVGEPPAPEEQERLFARWRERLAEITRTIRNRRPGPIEKSNFLVNLVFSGAINRLARPKMPGADSQFWADERCDGCGTCTRVCQARNVILVDGRPVWQHHCDMCYACLQWCPLECIQPGRKTQGRRRYHHPRVRAEDISRPVPAGEQAGLPAAAPGPVFGRHVEASGASHG